MLKMLYQCSRRSENPCRRQIVAYIIEKMAHDRKKLKIDNVIKIPSNSGEIIHDRQIR